MQDAVPSIDEMPFLKARLGKARTDKVRYAQKGTGQLQDRGTNLQNPVLELMQGKSPEDPGCRIADILMGVVQATEGGQREPLNIQRLYAILQVMPVINTREIQLMTGLNARQAQRYVKAVKLAMPHLKKYAPTPSVE